jgi:hypothetical protein
LKNAPFYPISLSDPNSNPRNTKCIPVVVFLDLAQESNVFQRS